MKVILSKSMDSLGEEGDTIEVKDGYARNFLIPKGIVLEATYSNLKKLEEKKKVEKIRLEKAKKEALELRKKLSKTSCTIPVKTEGEKMFGAVTAMDIVAGYEDKGVKLDKTNVVLEDPIKELGVYNIPVKLHPEVTAEIKVWVVKE